jgi:hypothetical protein
MLGLRLLKGVALGRLERAAASLACLRALHSPTIGFCAAPAETAPTVTRGQAPA